jgi:hypothetical protein
MTRRVVVPAVQVTPIQLVGYTIAIIGFVGYSLSPAAPRTQHALQRPHALQHSTDTHMPKAPH